MKKIICFIPLIFCFIFICVLFFNLFSSGKQNRNDQFPGTNLTNTQPIKFKQNSDGQFIISGTFLNRTKLFELPSKIGFLIGSHRQSGLNATGTLQLGSCSYNFSNTINDNKHIIFNLDKNTCSSQNSQSPFIITLTCPKLKKLSLWVTTSDIKFSPSFLLFQLSPNSNAIGFSVFPIKTEYSGSKIINKLAYVWNMSVSSILFTITIGIVFVSLGFYFCYYEKQRFLGTFLCGISILFATLMPPLQGPDEPDHIIGMYAQDLKTRLGPLQSIAKKTHFERIKFRSSETFSTSDMGRPLPIEWAEHVIPVNIHVRSFLGFFYWPWLSNILSDALSPHDIYISRLLNCLLVFLIVTVLAKKSNYIFFLSIFLYPFFTFISIMFSNYSYIFLLLLPIVAMIFDLNHDKIQLHYIAQSMFLGILSSLLFFEAKSVSILLPLILVSCLLIRTAASTRPPSSFWFLFCLGLSLSLLFLYYINPIPFNHNINPIFSVLGISENIFLIFAASIVISVLVCLFLEYLFFKYKPIIKSKNLIISLCWSCLLIQLILSCFINMPNLSNIETDRSIQAVQYFLEILVGFFSWFRLSEIDFYLQSSFLGGFGWLDTIPFGLCYFLILITPALLVVNNPERETPFRWDIIALVAFGCCITLFGYALGTSKIRYNLHGRYLIGFYLFLFLIITQFATLPEFVTQRLSQISTQFTLQKHQVLLVLNLLVYLYVLTFICSRYFG